MSLLMDKFSAHSLNVVICSMNGLICLYRSTNVASLPFLSHYSPWCSGKDIQFLYHIFNGFSRQWTKYLLTEWPSWFSREKERNVESLPSLIIFLKYALSNCKMTSLGEHWEGSLWSICFLCVKHFT